MKKEEKKIRKVFTDYVVFWNNHEIDKWGVLFTEDTKFITWSGGRYDSNKANIESHKKAHKFLQESKQNMTYQLDDISMEFLHDDIALVYATWIWTDFKTDDNVEDRSGYLTMVLVKSDDRWLIKTTQNTRIDKVLG
ncbi:SgcJ/EcaC family oxidoreductase [Sphingobacterium hotanense]|nr:SgcJ/EcaC family oxidoreductase [Sphingobacterium hotanense]MCT1524037.1 SgcJ/EcaC family oxidoreductase [Sphingobacterium hotanense]